MKTKQTITALFFGLIILSGIINAQCPTFGNFPPPYNSASSFGANYLLGTKHTLSTSFSLGGLGFQGTNTGAAIQMAIYTDVGNMAGNLVAYTNPSTVGSGNTVLSVITPTVLPPGDYWIMAVYNQSGGHVPYTGSAPNTVCYISLAFGSPIPSSASWITYTGQDFNYWASGASVTANTVAPICQGAVVTLSASGATSYLWSNGATTNSISVTPSTTTNYTVTGSGGSCPGSAIVTVTVTPSPSLTIVGPSTVCLNSPISQTVITTAPSYTWNNNSNASVITLTPTTDATVSVWSINANNCIGTATNAITVLSLPVISVNDGTICTGNSFTIVPNESIPFMVSGGPAIVSPTTTTSYSITGIGSNGCTNSVVNTVFVNPLPTFSISSSSPVLCAGRTATITVSGASSYSWNTGATASMVPVTPSTTITYTINGTDVNGCTNKSVFTQTVEACLGLTHLNADKNQITVYPNPTNGILNVEFNEIGTVFIYNSIGQLLFSHKNETLINKIDISGYKAGVYYLVMKTTTGTFNQKIIKE